MGLSLDQFIGSNMLFGQELDDNEMIYEFFLIVIL